MARATTGGMVKTIGNIIGGLTYSDISYISETCRELCLLGSSCDGQSLSRTVFAWVQLRRSQCRELCLLGSSCDGQSLSRTVFAWVQLCSQGRELCLLGSSCDGRVQLRRKGPAATEGSSCDGRVQLRGQMDIRRPI